MFTFLTNWTHLVWKINNTATDKQERILVEKVLDIAIETIIVWNVSVKLSVYSLLQCTINRNSFGLSQ